LSLRAGKSALRNPTLGKREKADENQEKKKPKRDPDIEEVRVLPNRTTPLRFRFAAMRVGLRAHLSVVPKRLWKGNASSAIFALDAFACP
jgi:hypothetical protein